MSINSTQLQQAIDLAQKLNGQLIPVRNDYQDKINGGQPYQVYIGSPNTGAAQLEVSTQVLQTLLDIINSKIGELVSELSDLDVEFDL